ncbi:MAG: ABC transporter permease [Candidatus Binataceae bacterium]
MFNNSNSIFLIQNLVLKDFRIRYRNMSLGVIWSVANPLLMMGILTFVFTRIFPNPNIHDLPLFVLCALVPLNFFTLSSSAGTTSLLDNQSLIKRVKCPRVVFPIASVLSSSLHLLIQIALLLGLLLLSGHTVNRYWFWLPVIWGMEVVFMCGFCLATAALDVYYRDVRYLVEASALVIFWAVPVFYTLKLVPARYLLLYTLNPITVVAVTSRQILLGAEAPSPSLLFQLIGVSLAYIAVGLGIFHWLERDFADYL